MLAEALSTSKLLPVFQWDKNGMLADIHIIEESLQIRLFWRNKKKEINHIVMFGR